MYVLAILAAVASLAAADQETCAPVLKAPRPPNLNCDAHKRVADSPRARRAVVRSYTAESREGCVSACLADTACKIFTFDSADGNCTSYRTSGKRLGLESLSAQSGFTLSNRNCYTVPVVQGPFLLAIESPDYYRIRAPPDQVAVIDRDGYADAQFELDCDAQLRTANGRAGLVIEDGATYFLADPFGLDGRPINCTLFGELTPTGNTPISCAVGGSAQRAEFFSCNFTLYLAAAAPFTGCQGFFASASAPVRV